MVAILFILDNPSPTLYLSIFSLSLFLPFLITTLFSFFNSLFLSISGGA